MILKDVDYHSKPLGISVLFVYLFMFMKFVEEMIYNRETIIETLPCAFYLKDLQLKYVEFNSTALKIAKINDKEEVIGRLDDELPWREFATKYQKHDRQVLMGQECIHIDPVTKADGDKTILINKKSPFLSNMKEIIGVAGVSFELTRENFREIASFFISNNFFPRFNSNTENKDFKYGDFIFSRRQAEVIAYLLRGYSAGNIGKILNISKRTVETHIINVKNQLGCQKKTEIIDQAFKYGFIDLITLK